MLLKGGALAAPVDIVEEGVIGASLGQDNIKKGFKAVLLGLALVLLAAAHLLQAVRPGGGHRAVLQPGRC